MKTTRVLLIYCIVLFGGCEISAAMKAKDYFNNIQLEFVESVCTGRFTDAENSLTKGAGIDRPGVEGMTPLIFALLNNHRDGVSFLLRKKANVNLVLSDGTSAVSIAASISDSTYLEMLLANGGDPNLLNPARKYSPLFSSIEHMQTENVRILLKYGAKADSVDRDGDTALKTAAALNRYDIAFELLRAGADPTIKNRYGKSALDAFKNYRGDSKGAMHQWRIKVVEILTSRGFNL